MGFRLVEKVYSNVAGTTPTAQAVLAFLAHRADDRGERKCFPSVEGIMSATHFGHSSIANALNDLRERKLLFWTSGGRLKGNGGKALANEYTFHLPEGPADKGCVRKTDNAYSTKRSMHTPRGGQSILHDVDTINNGQPSVQPSVIGATEAEDPKMRAMFESVAANWSAKRERAPQQIEENRRTREEMRHSVVDEAMRVCGVNDMENKKIFSSTLLRRSPDDALEVIRRFESELKMGEHKNLRNPASALNSALADLPCVV